MQLTYSPFGLTLGGRAGFTEPVLDEGICGRGRSVVSLPGLFGRGRFSRVRSDTSLVDLFVWERSVSLASGKLIGGRWDWSVGITGSSPRARCVVPF